MKRQKAMRRRSDVSSLSHDLSAPNRLGHGMKRWASRSKVPRAAASVPQVASPACSCERPGVVAVEHPHGGDRGDRDDVRDQVERAPLPREADAGAARDEPAAVPRGCASRAR